MTGFFRVGFLSAVFMMMGASHARADWLLAPYAGMTFAGSSARVEFDLGASGARHWLLGGSAGWLSDYVIGVEADFAYIPNIFKADDPLNLVISSRAVTLSGNVLATVPLSVSRESLRPYLLGGLGLLHASAEDRICLEDCETLNELAVQVGGGAIGFVTNRAGVRFDLRHVRSLSRDEALLGERRSKLSFWRASVGVVIRY